MAVRRRVILASAILLALAGSYVIRACSTLPKKEVAARIPVSPLLLSVPDHVHFLQTDPAWAHARMGNSPGTLSDFGCTLTAVSMAAANLGVQTDPGLLNAALSEADGYTPRGWLKWSVLEDVTDGALKVSVYGPPRADQVDRCLSDGHYPIVKFKLDDRMQHWALVVGKTDADWVVRDPLDETRTVRPLGDLTSSLESVRCIRPG